MQRSIDEIRLAGQVAWSALQQLAKDLPDVTILFDNEPALPVALDGSTTVYLAPATLDAGPDVTFAALAHDAVHILAELRDVRDTSRKGTYHNQRFAKLANELGFDVRQAGPPHGYADLRWRWGAPLHKDAFNQLANVLPLGSGFDLPLSVCRSRRTQHRGGASPVAVCACDPPRIIRISRGVLNLGGIVCQICYTRFRIRGD